LERLLVQGVVLCRQHKTHIKRIKTAQKLHLLNSLDQLHKRRLFQRQEYHNS